MMTTYNVHPISTLRRHCSMYLYGSSGSLEFMTNKVAQDFYTFALLHLISTMFITTDPPDKRQGIFHRILDPMGQSDLLTEIDRILDSPLGDTTLRQFIRSKRNKLATHGNVAFSSQPDEVQNVTFDDQSLQQYQDAMTELDGAVFKLDERLRRFLIEKENNPEQIIKPDADTRAG